MTSLNWFARVMFAEYDHSCEHNSKDKLKEYINNDSLTRFLEHFFVVVCERKYFAIVSMAIGICQIKMLVRTRP